MDNIRRIPYYGVIALLVYMPFHIFLSQWLSVFTGGLTTWKIGKDVFTIFLTLICILMVWRSGKFKNTPYIKIIGLSFLYGLFHVFTYLFNRHTTLSVAILGTVYNNRLLWFLIIGMSAALLFPKEIYTSKVLKLAVCISTIVCLIGIAQYFLPKDILTHFGYSIARGVKPNFYIDDKLDFPRIMSTLRDPNSLGAYLILPITLLTYVLIKNRDKQKYMFVIGLLAIHVLALFLTFSRSAWAASLISVVIIVAATYKTLVLSSLRRFWIPLGLALILLIGLVVIYRHNYVIQNVIVHSDKSTKAKYDSNGYHIEFVKEGLIGIKNKPLGHGPGTAGIVSIQNKNGGLLTENYYVQIGYEIGVIGLLLFIYINVYLYTRLMNTHDYYSVIILSAFWGYLFMNMLLHTWSNEAVAAQWWILAGVLLISSTKRSKESLAA